MSDLKEAVENIKTQHRIELDTAEQEKMDEELRDKFSKIVISRHASPSESSEIIFHLAKAIHYSTNEEFQILKHAAQQIADKYNL